MQKPHNEVIFELVGDETALQYFMVDDVSGEVSLRKSLVVDPEHRTQYNVGLAVEIANFVLKFDRLLLLFSWK